MRNPQSCSFLWLFLIFLFAGCSGGGGGGGGTAPASYTVGGTVSGLSGTGLVLQNNGGDNLAIGANGNFSFATALAGAGAYSATVLTQPTNLFQICVVTSGVGVVTTANVTNIAVSCTTHSSRYAYVASPGGNSVSTYVVDAATGRLKFIDTVAAGSGPISVTVDPSGKYAYVANGGSNNISQYTIGTNGGLTPMATATVAAGSAPYSVITTGTWQ